MLSRSSAVDPSHHFFDAAIYRSSTSFTRTWHPHSVGSSTDRTTGKLVCWQDTARVSSEPSRWKAGRRTGLRGLLLESLVSTRTKPSRKVVLVLRVAGERIPGSSPTPTDKSKDQNCLQRDSWSQYSLISTVSTTCACGLCITSTRPHSSRSVNGLGLACTVELEVDHDVVF